MYSLHIFKRFAFRTYNACLMQFWPGAKHSTYNAISVRTHNWTMLSSLSLKLSHHKREKQTTHSHNLIEAKMYMKARIEKQRKEKNDEMVRFRSFLLCVSFSSCSSLAKSCHTLPTMRCQSGQEPITK